MSTLGLDVHADLVGLGGHSLKSLVREGVSSDWKGRCITEGQMWYSQLKGRAGGGGVTTKSDTPVGLPGGSKGRS